MPRLSGSAWPFILRDDRDRIIGLRGPDDHEIYFLSEYYGAWRSTQDQAVSLVNTATPVTFNVSDYEADVALSGGDTITFATGGVWEFAGNFQLSNDTGTIFAVTFWPRINGVDAPNTARVLDVPKQHAGGHGHAVLAASYFFTVSAGDQLQIMWSSPDVGVILETKAADVGPAVPSVFMTVRRVS